MYHNPTDNWIKELAIMLFTGSIYGSANTLTGHPLDTIKTKMQVQQGFEGTMLDSIKDVWKREGFIGFYRGVIPPLWGSAIYRSLQFSAYQAHYAYCENEKEWNFLMKEVPFSGGIQWRTLTGGVIGGSIRSIVECPIEYAKVKRQTGQNWQIKDVYSGFSAQYIRSTLLLVIYFIQFDTYKRKTELLKNSLGQFFVSGTSSSVAFLFIWPFEVLKNQIQSGKHHDNVFSKLKTMKFLEMYRGILPGLLSVFIRNGFAMIAMQKTNNFITEKGWR